ncbi:MAG: tetratricopeptide repeat protein [Proteobacteria bacterium]|nr:tetratricopeptide repeat protein [Pseudomonadota bacterium]
MQRPPQNQIAAPLARAIGFLQKGQWAQAEQALAPYLATRTRDPDGLQLLGVVRAAQGHYEEAEALYRRSLAIRPNQPNVYINFGKMLLGTGRVQDAVTLLRAGTRAMPNHADMMLVLAEAQIAFGENEFAERTLRAILKLRPNEPSAALSLSGILNQSGRTAESETLLRAALTSELQPQLRAALEHNLGVALKLQRRYADALGQFDAALKRSPDLQAAHSNRANTLSHLGRQEEAAASYREALKRNPRHLASHQELNALLYRMGRDGEFLRSYDDALKQIPEAPDLLAAKGLFLNRLERFEEAEDCFARAAKAAPDWPVPLDGQAIALAERGRLEDAVAAYEKSLKLNPGAVPTQVNLASTLVRLGDAARALALTDAALAGQPHEQAALAVRDLALRLANDPRAEQLAHYRRHIQIFDLEPPEGFADMASFNAALNASLDRLHGDAREHFDQTLRHGTQTMDPLFEGDDALIAALRQRIDAAVADYIARMPDDGSHPLSSRRSGSFRYTGSWSSRLRDRGFHTNHIHPAGWISSCYYVAVPPESATPGKQQGWIKFGEPSFKTPLARPVQRAIQPVAGRLVLFPSYMWHGTRVFESEVARTTIAFDAVPA